MATKEQAAKEQRTSMLLAIPGLVMLLSGWLMSRDAIEGGHAMGYGLMAAGALFVAVGVGQFARSKLVGR